MKFAKQERKSLAAREVEALTREAEQYVAVGMLDRAMLVNVELRRRGADVVPIPKQQAKQTRQSAAAASRSKRG